MSQYPVPQNVKGWKKEIEAQLKRTVFIHQGEEYVKFKTATHYMRECFTKGFKVSRRDRTSLTLHMMEEMKKYFIIKPIEPPAVEKGRE